MKIVIIEENISIRRFLKAFLNKNFKNVQVYTSENGVEGLGLVYVVRPDLILVDTTLPKYSGREIVEFLSSNDSFKNGKTKVIIMNDGSSVSKTLANFKNYEKKDKKFLKKIGSEIINFQKDVIHSESINPGFLNSLGIRLANKSDLMWKKFLESRFLKVWFGLGWLYYQILLSLVLTIHFLLVREIKDSNIQQNKIDSKKIAVKAAPTLAGLFATFLVLFSQIFLFVLGGVVILNTRVNSIFATGESVEEIFYSTLTQSRFWYQADFVEFTASGVQLKSQFTPPDVGIDPPPGGGIETQSIPSSYPESYPQENVLGVSKSTSRYSTNPAHITLLQPIEYTDLINFEEFANKPSNTTITYQLSPDGTNWYYFESVDTGWVLTTAGFWSSNTAQEVQQNLELYESLFDSGSLYITAFLKTDNPSFTPILQKINITLSNEIVSQTPDPGSGGGGINEITLDILDFNTLEPQIFTASYYNGNKIVTGKILGRDRLSKLIYRAPSEVLSRYEAVITYEDGTLIGTTDLYLNSRDEIAFKLVTNGEPGGFIVVQIRPKVGVPLPPGVVLDESPRSKRVLNSTFTVDSTSDEPDALLDGLCETALGECTLRAAIQEANNTPGFDIINFAIPVTDSGYRDYDSPGTPGSGDSLNGDDYWVIRPQVNYPTITEAINLNVGSQRTNISDTNNLGPEIEITGIDIMGSPGLVFDHGSSGTSEISEVVVNGFVNAVVLHSSTNMKSTYLGTDVRGQNQVVSSKSLVISPKIFSNITIGSTAQLEDRNVISQAEINFVWGTGGNITLVNNYFGLNSLGSASILSPLDTPLEISSSGASVDSLIKIGENLTNGRNYFASGINVTAGGYVAVEIKNNLFGVDTNFNLINHNAKMNYSLDSSLNSYVYDLLVENNLFLQPAGSYLIFNSNNTSKVRFYQNTLATDSISPTHYAMDILATFTPNLTENQIEVVDNFFGGDGINPDPFFGVVTESASNELLKVQNVNILVEDNIFKSSSTPDITNFFADTIAYFNNNIVEGGGAGLKFSSDYSLEAYGNEFKFGKYGIKLDLGTDVANQTVDIKGNLFYLNDYGLFAYLDDSITSLDPDIKKLTLGGSLPMSGSKCEASEKNCFEQNRMWGVVILDSVPENENNVYYQNTFVNNGINNDIVDGVGENYAQAWRGGFELFNKDQRVAITGDFVSKYIFTIEGKRSPLTAQSKVCPFGATECPASGDTTGVLGESTILDYGSTGSNMTYLNLIEYYYDNVGNKVDVSEFVIDSPHLAQRVFSFDGDASNDTANVTQGAGVRNINGFNYEDRGMVWTNNPTATRDTVNHVYARFQLAEVEFVDANPIWHNNQWWIVVDSTLDTDNVSSEGYDDGGGAYSGGGLSGSDGVADGKTTLKEALFVANNLNPSDVKNIVFCIPNGSGGSTDGLGGLLPFPCGIGAADPNYNNPIPSKWRIEYQSDVPSLPYVIDSNFHINNDNINLIANQAYNWINPVAYPDPAAKPRIVIDFLSNYRFEIGTSNAVSNIQIKGLEITRNPGAAYNIFGKAGTSNVIIGGNQALDRNVIYNGDRNIYFPGPGSSNISILGNFLGVKDDGVTDQTNSNIFNLVFGNSYVSDIVVGSPGWGRNIISGAGRGVSLINCSDAVIQNNYIGVGYDGETVISEPHIGILLDRVENVLVGGDIETEGNVIAGNKPGIFVRGLRVPDITNTKFTAKIEGNRIGYTASNNPASILGDGIVVGSQENILPHEQLGKVILGGEYFNLRNLIYASQSNIRYDSGQLIVNHNCLGTNYDCTEFFPDPDPSFPAVKTTNITVTYGVSVNSYKTNDQFTSLDIDYTKFKINSNYDLVYLAFTGNNDSTPFNFRLNEIKNSLTSFYLPYAIEDSDSLNWPPNYDVSALSSLPDDDDVDEGINNLQNFPEILKAIYLGGGYYQVEGVIDGNSSEAPFEVEVCKSFETSVLTINNYEHGLGQCEVFLGNTFTPNVAGVLPEGSTLNLSEVPQRGSNTDYYWSKVVYVEGVNENSEVYFSTSAINNYGGQSQYGPNFLAQAGEENFEIKSYFIPIIYPSDDGSTVTDDATPVIDWIAPVDDQNNLNPDTVVRYEVYIDNAKVGETSGDITHLSIINPLSVGQHTLKVLSFGLNGESEGESKEVVFVVIEPQYSFELIYPVDVVIDDVKPIFSWSGLSNSAGAGSAIIYDLYLDGELFASNLNQTQYQNVNLELDEGNYEWFVVAYRLEPDSSKTEISRTTKAEFEVRIPSNSELASSPVIEIKDDVTNKNFENKDVVSTPLSFESSKLLNDSVVVNAALVVTSVSLGSIIMFLNNLKTGGDISIFGVILGWIFDRKKKYWGFVIDGNTNKGVPLAIVRFYKEKAHTNLAQRGFVYQSISDLKGRYRAIVEDDGYYFVEVRADGYETLEKKIYLTRDEEINRDFEVVRVEDKSNKILTRLNLTRLLNFVILAMILGGFFYTIYATLISPVSINFLILALYVFVFIINLIAPIKERFNQKLQILEAITKKPLPGVSVRFYDDNGKQLDIKLTNKNGIILINSKARQISLYKEGYENMKLDLSSYNKSFVELNKNFESI
ncbi:MAG: hypothetical protein KatS3mg085_330 [Candidatus Dojkabacteria bacterium]|nr:MAG: hypothetical protein KatS3mg085_330 [Candidatus Dojkabacteria bacterium]